MKQHFSWILIALGITLSSCQDAQYDAFRFGPDPGGDKSEVEEQVEEME